MYKLYQKPVTKVKADVKLPPPKISRFFIIIVSIISRFYIFSIFGVTKIILNDDLIFDVFKNALLNKKRYIIAFRHPDGREPQLILWFILYKLKSFAAKKKIHFTYADLDKNDFPVKRPHSIFVYGYEVACWGGKIVRIFLPKLGAIPIHHTKMDSKGMTQIHNAIVNTPYPLALAPEGQVSYSADTLPRLEQGVVRIGFQAAAMLKEKNIDLPLVILPLSFHLRYGKNAERAMEKLLKRIENICGLKNDQTSTLKFSDRLKQCRNHILEVNENNLSIKSDNNISFNDRLTKVIYTSLETAEHTLAGEKAAIIDIKDDDDFFVRLYKVRHECWDRIFVPCLDNVKNISRLQRSIMDLRAGEAWYASRHQEISDFGWYFRCEIPTENDPLHLKVEYIQNLFDFANRTMGGAFSGRVYIPQEKIILNCAPPINISDHLIQYKEDKRETIARIMTDLNNAFLDCINSVNKSNRG